MTTRQLIQHRTAKTPDCKWRYITVPHSNPKELTDALQSAGALFGVLLTQTAVVAVAQSHAHVMHPHDLLLLANLVRSNESFRQAETFTPVCMPHFNPTAFLHAYVQYLHVVSGNSTHYNPSSSNSMFVQDRPAWS